MSLTKYKLGDLIQLEVERNVDSKYSLGDVKGISINKVFIETKADMKDVSLLPYIIVKPDYFAYVTVTSRNGDKITLAHNTSNNTYIVSSSYVVFSVNRTDILNPDYLFMFFNRPEFDRYARFNSWGSARETFSWDDMCDIDIELPSLPVQNKYVDTYNAIRVNQQSYERGLDDLRLVFEGYINDLRSRLPLEPIGSYIELCEEKNNDLTYNLESVRGVSIEKKLIETKADMTGVSLKPYCILKPNEFAYVTVTSRNGEKISLAINNTENTFICSSSYVVFRSKDKSVLLPQYLMLYLSRSEFDRYSRFNSWGSARETFDWSEMCEVKIPIPNINIQQAISRIYDSYIKRKEYADKLKLLVNGICSVLIAGSLRE